MDTPPVTRMPCASLLVEPEREAARMARMVSMPCQNVGRKLVKPSWERPAEGSAKVLVSVEVPPRRRPAEMQRFVGTWRMGRPWSWRRVIPTNITPSGFGSMCGL